ncbi:MAG: GYD domain-containing protein [Alphaproteobacteria bacterium]|jgi:uncharacterized protein with GYD domain|nr:GYD domain-containing protein [Alphaproteobacteria bacterium]MDP6270373.1 GYD domain-containing protein [Alphaproteobacteria bacterium]MDP7164792.1 GYD domain-containing protein [Alphaproteobacteria bacterium]
MKYVLLGKLSSDWMTRQEERLAGAKAKLADLGITIDAVYYTQGEYDFVDIMDAPDATAMLAFSVWYGQQGFGSLQTLPAFDEAAMAAALGKL